VREKGLRAGQQAGLYKVKLGLGEIERYRGEAEIQIDIEM